MAKSKKRYVRNDAALKEQLLVDLDSPASKQSSLPSSAPDSDAPIYRHHHNPHSDFAEAAQPEGAGEATVQEEGEFERALGALQFEPSPVAERMGGGAPWEGGAVVDADDEQLQEDSSALQLGHTRSPVLAPVQTPLDSLSRTIRAAIPSPPRVSRPVSFGSFLPPSAALNPSRSTASSSRSPALSSSPAGKRRGSSAASTDPAADLRGLSVEEDVFVMDEDGGEEQRESRGGVRYPGTGAPAEEADPVLWARWDESIVGRRRRSLLLLGYDTGIQIWDCTDLGAVSEMLNLKSPTSSSAGVDIEHPIYATILPPPSALRPAATSKRDTRSTEDQYADARPLLGMLSCNGRDYSDDALVIYSLRRHGEVTRIPFHGQGVARVEASAEFVVVSTISPPTLHVLCSRTFTTLQAIPSSHLAPPFAHPLAPRVSRSISISVSVSNAFSRTPPADPAPTTADDATPFRANIPQPVFSLSHRLLAYASSPPTAPEGPRPSPPLQHPSSSVSAFGITQADIGNTALRVGGSVFGGMKALGGMAISAIQQRAAPAEDRDRDRDRDRGRDREKKEKEKGAAGVSKSAPSAISAEPIVGISRRTSTGPETSAPSSSSTAYVSIVDLASLTLTNDKRGRSRLDPFSRFVAWRDQPVSELQFAPDGTTLAVSRRDGTVVRVFRVGAIKVASRDAEDFEPAAVYELKRGRTSGVVEDVVSARDERWIAIGTRARTVHVFATNPYGGPADDRSHLEGRVRNCVELQPLSTELSPLVRLRAPKPGAQDRPPPPPLAFSFVDRAHTALPGHLLPPALAVPSASRPRTTSTASAASPGLLPLLPSHPALRRPRNYQDVLLFDPADGVLSLRRVVVEKRAADHYHHRLSLTSLPAALPVPGSVSASVPAGSPRSWGSRASPSAVDAAAAEKPVRTELYAKESVCATWNLRRGVDWGEIRKKWADGKEGVPARRRARTPRSEWLAQAELSTFSRAPRVLPRAIYLSHQFSFFALGEDYHALVRRYQLDVPVTKVSVRRDVQIVGGSGGGGGGFDQTAFAQDFHGGPSSSSSGFDEPLASAMSAGLDYDSRSSPPVLPMYPNGLGGGGSSLPKGYGVPIRSMAAGLSDGMSEGLGRLRREMGRVRSPRMVPVQGSEGPVPLEFDEVDEEDFVAPSVARRRAQTATEEEEDVAWKGWEADDMPTIEEAERFDDLVVGFMDEEQAHRTVRVRAQQQTPTQPTEANKKVRRKKW
ncbi:hypothetical protein PUNSTDRAFT_127829 [Punctularia strigosozonata HHB-11173 SS5]|uniref:uncharacterized protein n=1 Tax=Punctularia strigosozonata (strain HHB-11173) TaxID=741275 RepID=UPI0004417E33|nr:uncharacterized protein PUNSTDRAFT_127829 [Punctularia strigosozonata HHB-11173 SS5]EIN05352.1 hypothetical protein PUNSTDRAFT_127829 [Punctularia strigosozonata HHB-11173 SS5]